jgi:hypothetical protein
VTVTSLIKTSLVVLVAAVACLSPLQPVRAEEKLAFPVVDADYYVIERWHVEEGKEAWFEDYWPTTILPVFEQIPGFQGAVLSTTRPDPTLKPEDYDFGPIVPLGPPEKAFLPHVGVQLNGVVTNTQINFESVLRGTYNFTVVQFWKDAEALRGVVPGFEKAWKRVYGEDSDPWKTLEKDLFSNIENHWDIAKRIIRP